MIPPHLAFSVATGVAANGYYLACSSQKQSKVNKTSWLLAMDDARKRGEGGLVLSVELPYDRKRYDVRPVRDNSKKTMTTVVASDWGGGGGLRSLNT